MGVLKATGEPEATRQLRLHFELHVYATLLVRGHRELADRSSATRPGSAWPKGGQLDPAGVLVQDRFA